MNPILDGIRMPEKQEVLPEVRMLECQLHNAGDPKDYFTTNVNYKFKLKFLKTTSRTLIISNAKYTVLPCPTRVTLTLAMDSGNSMSSCDQ